MARERAKDEQHEEKDLRRATHSSSGPEADEDRDNDHLSLAGDEPLFRRPRTRLGSSTGPNTPDEVPTL